MIKEILGGNLDNLFGRINIKAHKSYETADMQYQVWELENSGYKKLCGTSEDDYQDDEWWRCSDGSNMGNVNADYIINGLPITAWDSPTRAEEEAEDAELPEDDQLGPIPRIYNSLLEYFSEELGASTERNVCALSIDLARQNGLTLAELFKKYYKASSRI